MANPARPQLLILGKPHEITLSRLAQLERIVDLHIARTQNEVASLIPDAEIVFVWEYAGAWLRENWKQAGQLRWVHFNGVGVESLLFSEFVESRIPLTNSRGYFANSLAEFVIAAILYFAKDVPRLMRNKLNRQWDRFLMKEIKGQTVGILGFGSIGRATASKAKGMEMRVVAVKREWMPGFTCLDVDRLVSSSDRLELFKTADYVVNTLPLTPETRETIGPDEFGAMRPDAYFINIGRGKTVKEEALVQVLREKRIGGAALDVFASEPLPPSSELYSLPNVLISPHCCDLTLNYYESAASALIDNLERYIAGEPLLNLVDKRRGY